MTIALAEMLVLIMTIYAAIGVVVGLVAVIGGASRFDGNFSSAPLQARFLVFWGAAALWPVILVLMARGRAQL